MSDPAKYRTKEELEDYKAQDPIERVKKVLLEEKYASEEELKNIDKQIKDRVLDAVKFAEESPYPTVDEVYKDVYVQQDYPYTQD